MRAKEFITEKWSTKYKRSINCNNPKGFSQRAHCQGRKKNEDIQVDERKKKRKKVSRAYGYFGYPLAITDIGGGGDGDGGGE